MEKTTVWISGHNDYKKQTLVINPETKTNSFTTELLDVEPTGLSNIFDIFAMHVEQRQTKFVDLLYSGGLDSECVLLAMLEKNIPCRPITMRIMINGFPVNLHDLYYSEKFCREHNLKQIFIDLDVMKFFENGNHLKYIEPYAICYPHVASHMWLIEQCSGFPVFAGDYSWPWTHQPMLSPHRSGFSCYDLWMRDNNITGIGNMINHSIDSNIMFIKTHLEVFDETLHDGNYSKIPLLKKSILERLGFSTIELRARSYGWESIPDELFNMKENVHGLIDKFGTTNHRIEWNEMIGKVIGAGLGSNDRFK
jgi:hypothetical protein